MYGNPWKSVEKVPRRIQESHAFPEKYGILRGGSVLTFTLPWPRFYLAPVHLHLGRSSPYPKVRIRRPLSPCQFSPFTLAVLTFP